MILLVLVVALALWLNRASLSPEHIWNWGKTQLMGEGDGEGYPPETAAYLDLTARLHRALAAQGDLVAEVVCGLPVIWKGETA